MRLTVCEAPSRRFGLGETNCTQGSEQVAKPEGPGERNKKHSFFLQTTRGLATRYYTLYGNRQLHRLNDRQFFACRVEKAGTVYKVKHLDRARSLEIKAF